MTTVTVVFCHQLNTSFCARGPADEVGPCRFSRLHRATPRPGRRSTSVGPADTMERSCPHLSAERCSPIYGRVQRSCSALAIICLGCGGLLLPVGLLAGHRRCSIIPTVQIGTKNRSSHSCSLRDADPGRRLPGSLQRVLDSPGMGLQRRLRWWREPASCCRRILFGYGAQHSAAGAPTAPIPARASAIGGIEILGRVGRRTADERIVTTRPVLSGVLPIAPTTFDADAPSTSPVSAARSTS